MIPDLKSYPAMKDSGIEWLGKVPKHWILPRMKTVLRERVQKGFPHEPMLAATQTKGVVRKEEYENRTVLALKDLHLLKLVREGDFVISLRSFQGGIEYAREQGIISPAYTILHSDNPENYRFLTHLFKSKPYIENLGLFVTGIREGQNINYEKLSRSRLPLPPPPEQAAIVRYLNYVDRRIRRYVRAKRKLIALLNEQKQAIIHQAITRGLDPDVPLKDSDVEWLGKVPEHWEKVKIKQAFKTTSGGTPNTSLQSLYYGGDIPWIRTMDLTNGLITKHEIGITPRALSDTACKIVPAGTVLIAMYGGSGTIGKNGLLCFEASLNQAVCGLKPTNDFVPEFVLRFIQLHRSFWMAGAEGSRKDPNISQERIRETLIIKPPFSEQVAIVEYLDQATANIDTAITRTKREIDLLNEYRTRLIADVVTGKLDVRKAAAKLPEVDPLASNVEAEDSVDVEDEAELEELEAVNMEEEE